jgi:hypothetical protein
MGKLSGGSYKKGQQIHERPLTPPKVKPEQDLPIEVPNLRDLIEMVAEGKRRADENVRLRFAFNKLLTGDLWSRLEIQFRLAIEQIKKEAEEEIRGTVSAALKLETIEQISMDLLKKR